MLEKKFMEASDGSLFPREIAQSAALLGIEAAALTDHDTMGGSEAFVEECGRLGLVGVTGCGNGVVSRVSDYKSELLGYFRAGRRATAGLRTCCFPRLSVNVKNALSY